MTNGIKPLSYAINNKADRPKEDKIETLILEQKERIRIAEEKAYEKAYTAGEAAGKEVATQRMEEIIKTIELKAAALSVEIDTLNNNLVEAGIDIIGFIAKDIIKKQISPHDIAEILEPIRNNLFPKQDVTIMIPSNDYEELSEIIDLNKTILTIDNDLSEGEYRILGKDKDILVDISESLKERVKDIKGNLIA